MKLHLFFMLFALAVMGTSCSPVTKTRVYEVGNDVRLRPEDPVLIFSINDDIPSFVKEIGTVKISDSGFSTKCDLGDVIRLAQEAAKNAGGEAIKIIKHKPPHPLTSSCDRITARILKFDERADYDFIIEKENRVVDSTWNYAKLYVYRPSAYAPLVSYRLYLDDAAVCMLGPASFKEIKVYKEGRVELWAKTETTERLPLDLEFGKEYYIRCSVTLGALIGRPDIDLIHNSIGRYEYRSLSQK